LLSVTKEKNYNIDTWPSFSGGGRVAVETFRRFDDENDVDGDGEEEDEGEEEFAELEKSFSLPGKAPSPPIEIFFVKNVIPCHFVKRISCQVGILTDWHFDRLAFCHMAF
jgi:hypothetical protein